MKMQKISPFVSVLIYVLSISSFLVAQLSVVSNTVFSGSVFAYNYPLRIAVNCFAIVCAVIAPFLSKANKWLTVIKILLSIFIIGFILIFGMRNNVMA